MAVAKKETKKYNFGEKSEEYYARAGKNLPVVFTNKYTSAKNKAIELIEYGKYNLEEADFWILMNATKSGKMAYTGLIISHNGCLKINDALEKEKQYRPDCITLDKDGYGGSLVYTYNCPEQGIYEVGELSKVNCTNAYPYAMALKRLIDRVILKNSGVAQYGIYSDSEADEFSKKDDEPEVQPDNTDYKEELKKYSADNNLDLRKIAKVYKLNAKSTNEDFKKALEIIKDNRERGSN